MTSRSVALLLAIATTACARRPAAVADAPAMETSRSAPVVERGPKRIAIDGDPNGLLWDADANGLLIADGDGNRILRWSDAGGVEELVRLPMEATGGRGLGQLVRLGDGTLVVTRFGDGESGGVVTIAPDGRASAVLGLDPTRRRIGLALGPDDTLYTAWFAKHGDERIGAVARLELSGAETVVVEGLQKPVGIIVQGDALIIADQRLGRILRAPLGELDRVETFVESIEDPDLLAHGPNGSLLTGGKNGMVRRIDADGTVSVVASGFSSVRGVAYDATQERLFIAEHDADDRDGIAHAIHIVPLRGRAGRGP